MEIQRNFIENVKVDIYDFDIYSDDKWLDRIKPKLVWSGNPVDIYDIGSDIFAEKSLLDIKTDNIKKELENIILNKKSNELFYDGKNARLESFEIWEDGKLFIWLSCFEYSINSSMWANYQIVSDIIKNESNFCNKISWWISINILPITSDGKYIYGKKKKTNDYIWWIVEYPWSFGFAKYSDGTEIDYKDYPIWYTIKKELSEETGIPTRFIKDAKVHALLLWWLGRFVLLSTVKLDINSNQAKEYFDLLDFKEHDNLIFFDSFDEYADEVSKQSEVKSLWVEVLRNNIFFI